MACQLLIPDSVCYNAAISTCEKGKEWQVALGFLQEMVRQLLMPNLLSCGTAISACEKGNQWQRALGLFEEIVC